MNIPKSTLLARSALTLAVLAALPILAHADRPHPKDAYFQRIATYVVCENTSCDTEVIKETVAEIIAVSKDGKTLVYTDSPTGLIGFVDISNPEAPVGLSEITALGGGKFAIIERDNQTGPNARIKRVYTVDVSGETPVTEGGVIPVLDKTLAIDALSAMQAGNGWVHDKLEGLARTADGTVNVVTDNDGVDDSTGETQFLNLGKALD